MKIKFTKEQYKLIREHSTMVSTSSNEILYYIPFWFKETDEQDVYEFFTFDLTDEIIETIKSMRDES